MATATLTVSRTSDRDLKFRGIEFLLDGKFIANLQYGDSISIDVQPGYHTLKATNRLKSASADFTAESGEKVAFQATGIALGGPWLVLTMLGTVAYRVTLDRCL